MQPHPSIARLLAVLFSSALLALGGCQSDQGSSSPGNRRNPVPEGRSAAQLRPGDGIVVSLQSIPSPRSIPLQIDEQGSITLPYIGNVKAGGLTASQLADAIASRYLDGKIYTLIDVSVTIAERFVYIGGEVGSPGRLTWSPDLTLSKAITAAGGWGLYARKDAVVLSRDEKSYTLNARLAEKDSNEDPILLPGDRINIPRSPF